MRTQGLLELTASDDEPTLLRVTYLICASTDKGLRQTLCPSSLTPSSKDVGRISGIAQQDHDLIQGLQAPHTVSVSFPTNPGSSLKSSREPKTAKMLKSITSALCITALVLAHSDHNAQSPIQGPHQSLWYKAFNTIPGDGGTQVCQLKHRYCRHLT